LNSNRRLEFKKLRNFLRKNAGFTGVSREGDDAMRHLSLCESWEMRSISQSLQM